MKTYEIKTIKVFHPELGELTKQKIIYHINDVIDSEEYYKEGETEIRYGYKLKA